MLSQVDVNMSFSLDLSLLMLSALVSGGENSTEKFAPTFGDRLEDSRYMAGANHWQTNSWYICTHIHTKCSN